MNQNVTAILQTIDNWLRLATPEERAEFNHRLHYLIGGTNATPYYVQQVGRGVRLGSNPAQPRYSVSDDLPTSKRD